MNDHLAVETVGLTKVFGDQAAVGGIDLQVPRGAVYGFLGPNGSGKTTTIRVLLGLVRASSGQHSLLGRPMPESAGEVLPRVGALVEGPAFHPYLSGRANLTRLDDADSTTDPRDTRHRVDEALDRVGLLSAGDKRYRAYSLGMGQRLAIAAALLSPRDLLVLDEPTNGLDPQGTREVRHVISSLADGGATVLVSSHLLAEVEQICTHIGVMHLGKLVAQGPVAELRASTNARVQVETPRSSEAGHVLRELGLEDVDTSQGRASATLGSHDRATIVRELVARDIPVLAFGVDEPSLEDLFVSLTGEGFDVST